MKLKFAFSALFAALISADSAFALSCARPNLIKSLEDAKASEDLYYILVGTFDAGAPPHRIDTSKPAGSEQQNSTYSPFPMPSKTPRVTQTLFTGTLIGQDPQQDNHLTRFPVDIETSCVGIWCGRVPFKTQEVVAFVKTRGEQPPLLKISACSKWVFSRNVPVQVSNIRQCLDKDCTDTPLRSPDAYTHPLPKR